MKARLVVVLSLLGILLVPVSAGARHQGTGYHSSGHHGNIKRSSTAREKFMRQTGYPSGRKGYVIDHIIPLSKGGADDPSNMQWQTVEEGKAKDKWERK